MNDLFYLLEVLFFLVGLAVFMVLALPLALISIFMIVTGSLALNWVLK